MKTRTIIAAALLASAPFMAAEASESEVLMRMLLKKGIISQAEFDEVMGELKEVKASEAAKGDQSGSSEAWADKIPEWVKRIEIGVGITGVVQGTSNNDSLAPNNNDDVIDGNYSVDLSITAPIGSNGTAAVMLEAGEGMGLQDDEVASFFGVNGDALGNQPDVQVLEAWYEHNWMEGKLVGTAGKVDLSNYFDTNAVANDETAQFLGGGFVNNAAVEFPDNGPGARLTYTVNDLLTLQAGWQEGDNNDKWEDLFEDPFFIGEVGLAPKLMGRPGNYRFYAWHNGSNHTDWNDAADTQEHNWGVGFSWDQQVSDPLTLFARLGYQDEDVSQFDIAWSLGGALSGSVWGRQDDTFGLAYGMAHLSDDYKDTNPFADKGSEGTLEAYYRWVYNDKLAITPHFMMVHDAQGNEDFDTVYIGGVRTQIDF